MLSFVVAALLTFCIAVGVDRMVGKAYLVAFPCGINNKVCREMKTVLGICVWGTQSVSQSVNVFTVVEVEEEAAHVFIVDLASAVCFVLRDNLQIHFPTTFKYISQIQEVYKKVDFFSSKRCAWHCSRNTFVQTFVLPLHSIRRWTRSSGPALWWRCPTRPRLRGPAADAETEEHHKIQKTGF